MAFDMKQRSFSQIDYKKFEATSDGGDVEKILIEQGILSTKETRYTGFVGGMVFIRYLLETGPWLFSFNAFLFVMVIVLKMASEWWVIKWAELSFTSISTGTYPIVLLIITVISS
jgi:hypothetical protein